MLFKVLLCIKSAVIYFAIDTPPAEEEGAVGGVPIVENIPEWTDPREDVVESTELSEVRRRRLERFSSQNNDNDDNGLDLD